MGRRSPRRRAAPTRHESRDGATSGRRCAGQLDLEPERLPCEEPLARLAVLRHEAHAREACLARADRTDVVGSPGTVFVLRECSPVPGDRLVDAPVEGDSAAREQHRAVAETLHGRGVVGDEEDRAALLLERGNHAEALPLEALVTDREHLVEQEQVRLEERGDREPEPHRHPGRVRAHRPVDRVLDLRERDDLVEPLADPRPCQALQHAVELDVLAPREVGVESGAELEQRADPAARGDPPLGRRDDPRDQTEQRRLAGPVAADEPDRLPGLDRERHVPESPHLLCPRPAAGDEQLLQRVRLAGAHDELPRDAVDLDLAGSHLQMPSSSTAVSRNPTER